MKTVLPQYGRCITNLTCSILNYYGAEAAHEGLPEADKVLSERRPKSVAVLLLDGLGANILSRTLTEDSFLRKHLITEISSVFPPTTVAATTSVETGLYPIETGWLGWETWFPEINNCVTTYLNVIKDTDIPAAKESLANKYMPYVSIKEILDGTGNVHAHIVSPYGDTPYRKPAQIPGKIRDLCADGDSHFMYIYINEPDEKEHVFGTDSLEAVKKIHYLDGLTEEIFDALPEDTVLFVIADHGHINSKAYVLEDVPELFSMLEHDVSIEPRATSYFVKEGMCERFADCFKEKFGSEFILMTKQEVLESNLFGTGKMHERALDMIGDYLSVAVSDKCIQYRKPQHAPISNHAGMTEDEMIVPLICASK